MKKIIIVFLTTIIFVSGCSKHSDQEEIELPYSKIVKNNYPWVTLKI